jgi:geranylgeranyl diphosphate synthase type II
LESADQGIREEMLSLMENNPANKVERILTIFKKNKVDEWALELKNKYLDEAFTHLEDIAVLSKRKEPMKELARFLIKREY